MRTARATLGSMAVFTAPMKEGRGRKWDGRLGGQDGSLETAAKKHPGRYNDSNVACEKTRSGIFGDTISKY